MRIPAANLKPQLDATRPDWSARLEALYERSRFILGHEGAEFEREFAAYTGARQVAGVGNGTAAIELCLRDAGLAGPHATVLTSPLTAAFTGVGIRASGARVTFADIDPETLLLDAADAGNRTRPGVKAIVPVHLYGQPCDLDRFAGLARDRGLVLIQDAAQAHGARCGRRPLTSFGGYVTYSFYPTKNLGALGDGGAIASDDEDAAARLRSLRDGGRRGGMDAEIPAGTNSRLDEVQACFLRAFLPHLAAWNSARASLAAGYDEGLKSCPGVRRVRSGADSVHHLYVIRADRRDALREFLSGIGIGAGVHYPTPLHLQPAFADAGFRPGDLPHAEQACREIISLPLWPYLPLSDAGQVVDAIQEFYRR